jgi:glycosyltransferase involved in cell wall biosynthesis
MKVCLVSALFPPLQIGGAETAARCLAERLAGSGWEVCVLTGWHRDESVLLPAGIRAWRIRAGPVFKEGADRLPPVRRWSWRLQNLWNPVAFFKLRRILAEERPQLVLIHNFSALSPAVFDAARALTIPAVFFAHDYFPLCRHYSFERKGKPCRGHCPACRLWARWNRRWLRRTPAVFLSERSRSAYRRQGHAGDSLLWPNPVDMDAGQVAAIEAEKASFRSRAPGATVSWLFMGRMDELKGISAVMRAWERLSAPVPRLLIAGDGPLAAQVRAWAAGRPQVEWLGHISGEEKRRCLIAADALLLPSRETDVSPLVLPEALAHGIPVLAAERGAAAESLRPGLTGWLCDIGDAGGFARHVAGISADAPGLRAMSAACFAAARERTYAAALPPLMEFLRRAASAGTRPD